MRSFFEFTHNKVSDIFTVWSILAGMDNWRLKPITVTLDKYRLVFPSASNINAERLGAVRMRRNVRWLRPNAHRRDQPAPWTLEVRFGGGDDDSLLTRLFVRERPCAKPAPATPTLHSSQNE